MEKDKILDERTDKILGIIYGCALGDAYGVQVEGWSKDMINEHYPNGVVNFLGPMVTMRGIQSGDWTDDTDQLILLFESIIEGFNVTDFARKLYNWMKHGFPELGDLAGMGLGQLTARVMSKDNFLIDPVTASREAYEELGGDRAPNGSLMRCGIAAISNRWAVISMLQTKVTHADARCIWCTLVITYICRMYFIDKHPDMRDILKWLELDYIKKYAGEIKEYLEIKNLVDLKLDDEKRGYVLKTFMCGIYAWRCIKKGDVDFKKIMIDIANQGGDVDTNCAVAGQVLGSYMGYDKLPVDWLGQLKHKKWLDEKISKLLI
jgi:ADP-ribosylglycohydrolase